METAPINDATYKLMTFAKVANVNDLPKLIEKPVKVEKQAKKVIWWGSDNSYVDDQLHLVEQSGLLSAILDSFIDQVSGADIRIKNNVVDDGLQAFLDSCNPKGETFYNIHCKQSHDVIKTGNGSLSNVWNKGKTGVDLYHVDVSSVRSGEADGIGNVNYYFTCSDWKQSNSAEWVDGNKVKVSPDDESLKVYEYPAFNKETRTGTQIIFHKPYSTGRLYYGQSIWTPVTIWAKIDAAIGLYHYSNALNNYMPSLIFNFNNGIPSPERAEEIYNDLQRQFSNAAGGAGRPIANFNNSKETAAEITVVNNNDNDQKFIDLLNIVMGQIIAGLRANPKLCGVEVPGKLGNDNIEEAQQLFYKVVIRPLHLRLEESYNRMLKAIGYKNEIEIVPLKLVVPAAEQTKVLDSPIKIDSTEIKPEQIPSVEGQPASAAVRSKLFELAGGLDSLGKYQAQVAAGQVSYTGAVAAIMDFFLVSKEKAMEYLGEPPAQPATPTVPTINSQFSKLKTYEQGITN